jgi:predicted ATPase/class 3 adenylate cyclase
MRYVFADCELDTKLCTVRRGTTQYPLRPKPLQVLLYLLEHCDRVVPKQELAEQLWPDQYISDTVIENSILAARRAIGDSGRAQRLIQTLHGHGYRLIVPVITADDTEEGPVLRPSAIADTEETPWVEALLPAVEEMDSAQRVEGADVAPVQSTAASPSIESARRQLTVLFCDLVGSTALSRQVDPEDYVELIRTYHTACAAVIERFAGHIAQYLGDGLLVYFGYPQAHEDDAQRAVYTALGILETLGQLNGQLQAIHGVQVTVRLGIHTGLVVMSAVGTGGRTEPLALGETPNIAARLQDLAPANTVVLSAPTYRLVHGYFACQALGAQSLPGLAAPIEVYQALQASGVPSRFAVAVNRGLTPLVGRERERDLLLDRWARARDGSGHVVLISGDVGIGKSRLVQALKNQVRSEPHTLLECQGLPYHQHTAFWPLTELLPRLFQWQRDASTATKLARIAHVSEQVRLPVEQTVPLFATLLALPVPAAAYPPPALTPEEWRHRIFDTLLTLILGLATHHPVLFVVEDLHWIDPSTLEFLELLVNQNPTAALLSAVTCRPTVRPSWLMRAHVTHVTLDRLGPELVQQMIGLVLGQHELPAAVRQRIVATTDGVPLFVEEVTKMVLEMGAQREGTPDAAWHERALTLTIPTTLHDLLMARLDHLGPAKGVAQLASTIGREFSYAVLQALAPWDEPTLQHGLCRLVEAELLYQRGLPPRATYLFKHALIRDAAYESLLKRTRQHYHRQIAGALEERFAETVAAQPELLAYHLTLSEAWDSAFVYLIRSGDKARQVYANQEAITFYTQAIEASGRITPALEAAQLLPVYEGRGLVWMLLTKYDAAIADFQMMRQTARASGNRQKEGESLGHLAYVYWLTFSEAHTPLVEQYAQEAMQLAQQTGDSQTLARSHLSLGLMQHVHGNLGESDRNLEASLRLSRQEGYHDVLAQTLVSLGMVAYDQGNYQSALQHAQEGAALCRDIHDGLNELRGLSFLCQACWNVGQYTQALALLHDGLTKAQERENFFIVGRLTNTLGWFHREFGAFSRAAEYDQESVELGRSYRVSNVEISALVNLGFDYLALDQPTVALSHLQPTLERVQQQAFGAHKWRWTIKLLIGLAELAYTTADYEQALRYVEQGLQASQATTAQKYIALGWALRGKIVGKLGDTAAAGSELQRALSLADQLQRLSLIYPIAYDLGQWYASAGKEREAVAMYGKAKSTIEQMVTAVDDATLRSTFLQSALVQAIREHGG